MSTPPPEAYEAAEAAAVELYCERNGFEPTHLDRPSCAVAYATTAVDAVWPIAERAVRAQVAAEIRVVDVEQLAAFHGETGRVGLTVAARIAEGLGQLEPQLQED